MAPCSGRRHGRRDPYGLGELVAALDDYAPDATGTLMLVGGTHERRHPSRSAWRDA